MNDEMECLCLECGISNYLPMASIALDDVSGGIKLITNAFCGECGGPLALIGKAGDEPCYRLKESPGATS